MMPKTRIVRLEPAGFQAALADLAALLHACVHDGASIGFVLPFDLADATAFWRDRVAPAVTNGSAVLWGAYSGGDLIGTVQLALPAMPNQTHRADVAQMLVHPNARRRGVARQLLRDLEAEARARALRLLVLDTRSGDPAQALYQSEGFNVAGAIPDYCRNPRTDLLEPTTYLYKRLT